LVVEEVLGGKKMNYPKQIRLNQQRLKSGYNKKKKIAKVETPQRSVKQLQYFEVSY
jgi:hypothetical protein